MGEMVEFPGNGRTGGGYLAPASEGAGLGVIVIQEWWGLVDHIVDVCDRFSAEGFTALAPDLYHGRSVPNREPDEAAKAEMALDLERASKDLSGAVDFQVDRLDVTVRGYVQDDSMFAGVDIVMEAGDANVGVVGQHADFTIEFNSKKF